MACRRLTLRRPLLCIALPLLFGAQAGPTNDDRAIAIGRDIYERALGHDPVTVRFAGGDWMPATQAHACRSCHGDSGEGGSEGTIVAPALPPLAAKAGDRWPVWLDNALLRHKGLDGHPLNAGMPDYRLSPSDKVMLGAYLRALPQVEVPGVNANTITIRVTSRHSGLSPAGERMLFAELAKLALSINDQGGIFGRRLHFSGQAANSDVLLDLAWRLDSAASAPTLTIQPLADNQRGGFTCGSLDPPEAERTRTLIDWSEKQGLPAGLAGDGGVMAGKAVVIPHDYSHAPQELSRASVIYAPADIAKRWPPAMQSGQVRIYAPGDLAKRSTSAETLIHENAANPRDALVTGIYLEGGALIVSTLKDTGRRIRRMRFCDTLRNLSRSGQSISIIADNNVIVVPVD